MRETVSVLVIDDSDCVRAYFQSLLEEMGHRMQGAASGSEALRILEREKPDIVVADLHLSKINGMDIIDWLKSNLPYATVIVLCGKNSQDEMREVVRRGAWNFLEKPLRRSEIAQALNGAVEQAKLVSGKCSPREPGAGICECDGTTGPMGPASAAPVYPISENVLAQGYDITIEGWLRALELHASEGAGHNRRVTELTLGVAREKGINEELLVQVRRGALLHDIGNLGVSDRILLKPGQLDLNECAAMKRHVELGINLLSPIEFLRPALDIPYCHHEKWDGTGYPRGLKGEEIPLSARIFAVADVWDALHSDRPQRPAWGTDMVRAEIASLSGSHFDPEIVQLFDDHLRAGEVANVSRRGAQKIEGRSP